MSSSFLVLGDLVILSHSFRGDWQGIICFSVPRYKVGGRRVDNGSIIGVESGDVTSSSVETWDIGLETRHWSTIVTAETADIPRNYSSPLPASIRVTAWFGSCISNVWQHYSDHPAYPLHSVLGTCLHSFLDVSAHFWLGILVSTWVLYYLLYSACVATWSATSSHSTSGRVRHCSSVSAVHCLDGSANLTTGF